MKCRTKYAEKPPVVEELAQRDVVGASPVAEQRPARAAVEPRDLGEHPQVARVAQVGRGREQAAAAERAGPLEAGAVVADRHRHLRRLGRDAELGEQPQQHRVGARVVHDEAGVDRRARGRLGRLVDQVGVGVAAEPVVGLEEGDVRGPRGDVGRGQARRPRSRRRRPGRWRATGLRPRTRRGRPTSPLGLVGHLALGLDGDAGAVGGGGVAAEQHLVVRRRSA